MQVIQKNSPNFTERKYPVEIIVFHATQTDTLAQTFYYLTSPETELSAHYVIDKDGTVYQLVDLTKRAHHAGVSSWRNFPSDLNSRSIGIEIQNQKGENFTEEQIASLIDLTHDLQQKYPHILPENIVGHSDIAPERKEDPNILFPWQKMAENGIGIWTKSLFPMDLSPLSDLTESLDLLHKIGYRGNDKAVAQSFLRHFLPEGLTDNPFHQSLLNRLHEIAPLYPSV